MCTREAVCAPCWAMYTSLPCWAMYTSYYAGYIHHPGIYTTLLPWVYHTLHHAVLYHAAALTGRTDAPRGSPGLSSEINNEDKGQERLLSLKGVKRGEASARRVTPLPRKE